MDAKKKPQQGTVTATVGDIPGRSTQPWLTITATSCTPGIMYLVSVLTPGGASMGDSLYPDEAGVLVDTNLPANYPGDYVCTVQPWHGGKVVGSATVTV
jgi:hypothetical protein